MEQSSQTAPARRQRRPWTVEDQLFAEALRAQGISYERIARQMGRISETVRCHLNPIAAESYRKSGKERSRRWRMKNPDKVRETSARYRRDNPEKVLEAKMRYASKHPEKIRSCRLKNLETNKDRIRLLNREACKRYQVNNREAYLESCRKAAARRRYARGLSFVPVTLDSKKARFQMFDDHCAYCGSPDRLTVDHVLPLVAGGMDEAENIVPACHRCNCSKNACSVEDWYRRQPFFSEARWRKIQRHCPAAVAGQLPLAFAVAKS